MSDCGDPEQDEARLREQWEAHFELQREEEDMTTDPDTDRGLYGKYRVEKVNGKPIGECFVLEASDPFAVDALRAYAESCVEQFTPLAADLFDMADRWQESQS